MGSHRSCLQKPSETERLLASWHLSVSMHTTEETCSQVVYFTTQTWHLCFQEKYFVLSECILWWHVRAPRDISRSRCTPRRRCVHKSFTLLHNHHIHVTHMNLTCYLHVSCDDAHVYSCSLLRFPSAYTSTIAHDISQQLLILKPYKFVVRTYPLMNRPLNATTYWVHFHI